MITITIKIRVKQVYFRLQKSVKNKNILENYERNNQNTTIILYKTREKKLGKEIVAPVLRKPSAHAQKNLSVNLQIEDKNIFKCINYFFSFLNCVTL